MSTIQSLPDPSAPSGADVLPIGQGASNLRKLTLAALCTWIEGQLPPAHNGVDGSTIRYGTGAPVSEFGNDGDFYLSDTLVLYGPKANGTWPAGRSLGGGGGTGGTIAPPVIGLVATPVSHSEGDSGTTTFTFTLTRTGDDLSGVSSVDWVVAGYGTNQASPDDFVGGVYPSGTVSFLANAASKTITVQVAGDTNIEPDEAFAITISNPVNATLGNASVVGTILNDDNTPPPVIAIQGSAIAQSEGNSGTTTFAYTLTRTGDLSGASTVDWAVTGSGANPASADDFVGAAFPSGTASFAPSASTATVNVQVNGDTTVEPDEGFTVTLSNPVGATIGTASDTGTIQNDDTLPTMAALTIAWDSPPQDNPPKFVMSGDVQPADSFDLEVSHTGAYAGEQTECGPVVIDGTEYYPDTGADFGAAETPYLTQPSGPLYLRLVQTRSGYATNYSNVINRTIYDAVPDPFSFVEQTGVAQNTFIASAAIVLTGLAGPTEIKVGAGAQYQLNGGSWTNVTGTYTPGDSLKIGGTSPTDSATSEILSVTVGGVTGTFQMVTAAAGVSILANANQPARLSTSGTTVTFSNLALDAGTPLFAVTNEGGGAAGAGTITITPHGGGTAVTCTILSRVTSTNIGDQDWWIGNSAIAAGNYDVTIAYSGGTPSEHYLMIAAMTGQTSNTPVDTCTLAFGNHNAPIAAGDSLVVNTNGAGIVFTFEWGNDGFTWDSGETQVAISTDGNTRRLARSLATDTPTLTGANGWVGMNGVSFA